MKKRDSIEYYDTHWSNERAYKKGVRDFAEKAKKELTGWETDPKDEEIEWVIDNLVKEMVGVDNGNIKTFNITHWTLLPRLPKGE